MIVVAAIVAVFAIVVIAGQFVGDEDDTVVPDEQGAPVLVVESTVA